MSAKPRIIPAVIVRHCSECPKRGTYDRAEKGCKYKYGVVSDDGFPTWCPLQEAPDER